MRENNSLPTTETQQQKRVTIPHAPMNADFSVFEDMEALLDPAFLATLVEGIDVEEVLNHFDAGILEKEPEPMQVEPTPAEPEGPKPAPVDKPPSAPKFAWMRDDSPKPPIVPEDPKPKTITGRTQTWEIGAIIATSEKATVCEAVGADGKIAAVKILPRSHQDNRGMDQEAAVACSLSAHPNILDFYDYVTTKEAGYNVMERAQGDLYCKVEEAS
eukprot:TRINITY_DN22082_c0_g1_i1.p1 TRINITY_DN22082_c0_g1~~TRINITY_DN22082_c0_g1_i1.p1  ORF type:complete len:216 (-),score=25.07 TRINITY_DN22082_c0_g1_i1:21-668(-)